MPHTSRRPNGKEGIHVTWQYLIAVSDITASPVWDGPTELWDAVTIGRLLYSGDRLGNFEAIYSYRRTDQRITGISWFGLSDQRWIDQGLSLKYFQDRQILPGDKRTHFGVRPLGR